MGDAQTKQDISFDELRKIVAPIAAKYGTGNIYLFGSRARGDNSEGSDFDFYIHLGEVRGLKLCGLLRELEEALGNSVDIVTAGDQLKEDFFREIQREMKLVYEAGNCSD